MGKNTTPYSEYKNTRGIHWSPLTETPNGTFMSSSSEVCFRRTMDLPSPPREHQAKSPPLRRYPHAFSFLPSEKVARVETIHPPSLRLRQDGMLLYAASLKLHSQRVEFSALVITPQRLDDQPCPHKILRSPSVLFWTADEQRLCRFLTPIYRLPVAVRCIFRFRLVQ